MYKFLNTEFEELMQTDGHIDFIEQLEMKWDEIHEKSDVFKYKIHNLKEKTTDSKFLLQLNPNRFSKRRTPEIIDNVCQPFDKNKFNFSKVSKAELLFHITNASEDTKHTLMVNVSPISRYHSLLCPSLEQCLPQVVTEESLQLVLDVMHLAKDRHLRIGFNSLCALASVNHLHYHLFLMPNDLPVESVKCKQVKGELYRFVDYPAPSFCFQDDGASNHISKDIFKLMSYFLENCIAHNIFITRGRDMKSENDREVIRIIIWPRKSCAGVKQLTAFNVAVCELSGWFPVSDDASFNTLSEMDLILELDKWKFNNFDSLCERLKNIF